MFGNRWLPWLRPALGVLGMMVAYLLRSDLGSVFAAIITVVAAAFLLKRRYIELVVLIAIALAAVWLAAVFFELFLATAVLGNR